MIYMYINHDNKFMYVCVLEKTGGNWGFEVVLSFKMFWYRS